MERFICFVMIRPMSLAAGHMPAPGHFGSPFAVLSHFMTSETAPPSSVLLQCSSCAFQTATTSDLELHRRSVHLGQRSVMDELCDNPQCVSSADVHLKNACKRGRPYICRLCGSSFKQKTHLGKNNIYYNR